MIKINNNLYVAEDQISEVALDYYGEHVKVTMKSGEIHTKSNVYGVSVYKQLDDLVKEINLHIMRDVV
jgi:DNA-binding transcriptional regulator WhiA